MVKFSRSIVGKTITLSCWFDDEVDDGDEIGDGDDVLDESFK